MNHLFEEEILQNITGNKVTHMEHSEDFVLQGTTYTHLMINALESLFNSLSGHSDDSIRVTVKIDGAPAVHVASDYYGKCFVATKSLFNKVPKLAYTEEDCETYYGEIPYLKNKMISILKYAKSLNIPKDQIWRGDFLFDKNSVKYTILQQKECLYFKPNTIVYVINREDPLYSDIANADIGIAWHTVYKGKDLENLQVSFDADANRLTKLKEVFQTDGTIPSIAGNVTMTSEETKEASRLLYNIKIKSNILNNNAMYQHVVESSPLVTYLNSFRNSLIKEKNEQTDPQYIDLLIQYIIDSFNKITDERKTQRGKDNVIERRNSLINIINNNKFVFEMIFSLQDEIVQLKEFFINKLNGLVNIQSYIESIDEGFIPVSPEGFVVSDIAGNVQKLCSRLQFSRNNFSKNIIKGWVSNTRK